MNQRSSSTIGRLLAPIALVAAVVAVVIVASNSLDLGSDDGASSTVTTTTEEVQQATPPEDLPKRYEVQPGDNLTTIAEQTGVPLDVLVELNPDLDAQALAPGQRVKLR